MLGDADALLHKNLRVLDALGNNTLLERQLAALEYWADLIPAVAKLKEVYQAKLESQPALMRDEGYM
jgi:hypothetical protein